MASNKLPKNGIIESLIDINNKLQRIQRSICCNSGGTGLTIVTTTDSDSVFFTGDGTPENPLSATTSGGSATDTIYSADGSIAGNRTVNLGASTLNFASAAGSTFSAILNTADSANTSMVRVRSGGGGGGVQLTTSGGAAGFQAGTTYGFRIQNGNNTNSIVTITGGGQFNVMEQSDIRFQRGTNASGDYSTIMMYPSSGLGPTIQDTKTTGTAQFRVEGGSVGNGIYSRFLTGSVYESNTQVMATGFIVNRVNNDTTIIPQFKVDTNTQKVILPLIVNSPFLKTDGTGNIVTGTKAAHVDPSTGTLTDVINALIAAGLMA